MNWKKWAIVAVIAFLVAKAPVTMAAFASAVWHGVATFWDSLNWH